MTAVTLTCTICGKRIFLQPRKTGEAGMVSLAGSDGWTYTSDTGWRCPDVCKTVAAKEGSGDG